jgi:hypothetical protein
VFVTLRVAVFIDYWNLQLTLNQGISKVRGVEDYRAKIDWRELGQTFITAAATKLGPDGD